MCEDLPFFRQLGYPHLAAFKLFYWKQSILQEPEFVTQRFHKDSIPSYSLQLAAEVSKLNNRIPSVAIWAEKTIQNTLKQVEYYSDCGLVQSTEDLQLGYIGLLKLLEDLTHDARLARGQMS